VLADDDEESNESIIFDNAVATVDTSKSNSMRDQRLNNFKKYKDEVEITR
jgi:hypothetical protein